LLDFPFNRRKRTCKVCLRFQRCHINISSVNDTLTPRKSRCQLHRWNRFIGVIDTTEIRQKNSVVNVPMTFFTLPSPWLQRCQLHRWNRFSGVNDTAEIVSAVSMTPRKSFQRCQCHRWNSNVIDFLGEYEAICETALGRESGP
jgi:uncharacterized protein YmfQ (DUF2313 family)